MRQSPRANKAFLTDCTADHVAAGNLVEAGLTLMLHADLYEWNNAVSLDPVPDLDLSKQTEFARREALFRRIIDYLGRGKAWETAIGLATELERQYESRTFDYAKLADMLRIKADLFAKIASSERNFGCVMRLVDFLSSLADNDPMADCTFASRTTAAIGPRRSPASSSSTTAARPRRSGHSSSAF